MVGQRFKRSTAACAAALLVSMLVGVGGAANAQDADGVPIAPMSTIPESVLGCLSTTQNVWILSGYCEAHDAWDRYFCLCEYRQRITESGNSGGDDGGGQRRPNPPSGGVDDAAGDNIRLIANDVN